MEELTDCEVLVMKVIWHSEEALSIQEITGAVNATYDKDWKVQTVSTFLSKMVKKGYLDMQRKGRYFFYYPLVTEEEYGDREIKKCVELWSDGKIDGFLAAFTRTHKLTEEERKRIGGMLDELGD